MDGASNEALCALLFAVHRIQKAVLSVRPWRWFSVKFATVAKSRTNLVSLFDHQVIIWAPGLLRFYNAILAVVIIITYFIFLLNIEKTRVRSSAQLWPTFCYTGVQDSQGYFRTLSMWFQNRHKTGRLLFETNNDFQESDRVVLRRGVALLMARLRGLVFRHCFEPTQQNQSAVTCSPNNLLTSHVFVCVQVMCRYRNVWNIDLKLRPAFLGGIMQGSGAVFTFVLICFKPKQRF